MKIFTTIGTRFLKTKCRIFGRLLVWSGYTAHLSLDIASSMSDNSEQKRSFSFSSSLMPRLAANRNLLPVSKEQLSSLANSASKLNPVTHTGNNVIISQ